MHLLLKKCAIRNYVIELYKPVLFLNYWDQDVLLKLFNVGRVKVQFSVVHFIHS